MREALSNQLKEILYQIKLKIHGKKTKRENIVEQTPKEVIEKEHSFCSSSLADILILKTHTHI